MKSAGAKRNLEDVRYRPGYTLSEAALYLNVSVSTLRSWTAGRHYPTADGHRFSNPVVLTPDRSRPHILSFINLTEAHVLIAIRRQFNIPFRKVRRSVNYLRSKLDSDYPLAEQNFITDGIDLFIENLGTLINISSEGQLAMREALDRYLQRIDRDNQGLPIKLYPFTRKGDLEQPKVIEIDPAVSYGRPLIAKTGIPTSIVAERYKAGESIEELAKDYALENAYIQEAIRCELREVA